MTMKRSKKNAAAKHLQWFGRTDRGKVRPNNEDAFLGLQFDAREVNHLGKIGEAALTNKDFVFAVSDGMGGAMAGEYASRIAVEKITRLLPQAFKQSAAGMETGFADVLTELFCQIHRALVYLGESYEECSGMEATLSLCWFPYRGRPDLLSARQGRRRQAAQPGRHPCRLAVPQQQTQRTRSARAPAPQCAPKGPRRQQPVCGSTSGRGGL